MSVASFIGAFGAQRRQSSAGTMWMYDNDLARTPDIAAAHLTGLPLTGIAMIDDDHRLMIGLYNKYIKNLSDAVEPREITRVFLSDIQSHAGSHFAREEMAMKAIGYDGYDHHKAAHDAFLRRVQAMAGPARQGRGDDIAIADFIRTWIDRHIKGEDHVLSDLIRERGELGKVNDMIVFSVLI